MHFFLLTFLIVHFICCKFDFMLSLFVIIEIIIFLFRIAFIQVILDLLSPLHINNRLCGMNDKRVGNLRQMLTKCWFCSKSWWVLDIHHKFGRPRFTIPYRVIYDKCQKGLDLWHFCLKLDYTLGRYWQSLKLSL